MTTTTERAPSPYVLANLAAGEKFTADTEGHELTILHDDGPYKHLLFKTPGESFYWYELIFWPGMMTMSGDMGTWSFRPYGNTDVMGWFRANPDRALRADDGYKINPDYWTQKLEAGHLRGAKVAKEYDPTLLAQHLRDRLRESAEDEGVPKVAIDVLLSRLENLIRGFGEHGGNPVDEHTDRQDAYDYSDEVHWFGDPDDDDFELLDKPERFGETYKVDFDWDTIYDCSFDRYDNHYLWCLHAIVAGIEQYDATVKAAAEKAEDAA
jgi:hypothetical protein